MEKEKAKVFSKERWLVSAYADKDKGILTQKEIDDACNIWVDKLDGKTVEQIEAMGDKGVLARGEWFV